MILLTQFIKVSPIHLSVPLFPHKHDCMYNRRSCSFNQCCAVLSLPIILCKMIFLLIHKNKYHNIAEDLSVVKLLAGKSKRLSKIEKRINSVHLTKSTHRHLISSIWHTKMLQHTRFYKYTIINQSLYIFHCRSLFISYDLKVF